MGISYRRRASLGRNSWATLSKSGVSASHRKGRVTVNSRGRFFVRLGRGLYWRGKL